MIYLFNNLLGKLSMQPEDFDILDEIVEIENIAINHSIRERQFLNRRYGVGH